jgi:prophage antirepressor-like protein
MTALLAMDIEIGDQLISMVDRNSVTWFVLSDVLSAMGIQEDVHSVVTIELGDSDKALAQIIHEGRATDVALVSEEFLSEWIFEFDNPETETFKSWFVETFFSPDLNDVTYSYRPQAVEMAEDELVSKVFGLLQARINGQE